jgi:integrase
VIGITDGGFDRATHHTYRAWLGDNGEALTVQKELMRHASIQTTLNTYGGGMMESMREAHGRVVKQAMAR